jgi:uncharacterized protein (TIGR03083 family)
MDVASYTAEIEAAAGRMADVLKEVPLTAHVPTCPAWVARDLLVHQGGIHRWAARIVAERRTDRHWMDIDDLGGAPSDAGLFVWFADGVTALTRALANAPEDLECWTFIDAPTPRIHWARRQAHETAIHRIDAEVVANAQTQHSSDLAADGIDEYLMAFLYRPNRGPRAAEPTSLGLAPVDVPDRWTITFDSESYTSERELGDADAVVRGTASDLYAWVWNRPVIGIVEIDGDAAAAGRYQANG